MGSLIMKWLITSLAFGFTTFLLSGVHSDSILTILIAALVFGLINALIKPVVLLVTLPINILSLGLFTFLINGFMIWLTSKIVTDFKVDGFWWGVFAAICISIITEILNKLFPSDENGNNGNQSGGFKFYYSNQNRNSGSKKVEDADYEVIE